MDRPLLGCRGGRSFGRRRRRGRAGRAPRPEALPPRSFLESVSGVTVYWFPYCGFIKSFSVRLDRARSTWVGHGRHLVDALVDARRYRYAGPRWLLQLIW